MRDDEYFVEPADWLATGRLWIDGAPVTGPMLHLSAGEHELRWEGRDAPGPPWNQEVPIS